MLDKGQEKDWFSSDLIRVLAVMAVMFLATFVIRELTVKDPIVHCRLLQYRTFGIGIALVITLGFVLYGGLVLLPPFMQTLLGWTATTAGIMFPHATSGKVRIAMAAQNPIRMSFQPAAS